MRHPFTAAQIAMLVRGAEQQFEQVIGESLQSEPSNKNIAQSSQLALHETVLTMIMLFRDQVPGAAAVATLIARTYARGVDDASGESTLACVRAMSSLVTDAGERHAAADIEFG